MKHSKLVFTLAIAVMLVALTVGAAAAQSPAYQTSFTTSVTYQNISPTGQTANSIVLSIYPEGSSTPIVVNRDPLAYLASTSIYIGSLNEVNPSFNGSAVLSSDQPLVATMVQVPQSSTVKNRPLSNGFASGNNYFLIATTLKNQFNSTSRFSVQNADTKAVNITVRFYNADNPGAAPITLPQVTLPVGAAEYYDLGTIGSIPSPFNGSATVEADGLVVASAIELSTNSTGASSFEGVTGGSNTVYMPSAICNAFGGQNTAYAVQNTGNINAQVVVAYSNGKNSAPTTIAPGTKKSFIGCDVNPANFSGSATITSTGAPIVAIGKVYGAGLSTAFIGATEGASKLALPYVRWSETQYNTGVRQRAYIAIQNVGGSNIPAGQTTVKYIDKNGRVLGTHTLGAINAGAKVNSYPYHQDVTSRSNLSEFGYYADGTFGGGAVIEGPAGSQLVAVVRIQSAVTGGTVAEDYNGIPMSAE